MKLTPNSLAIAVLLMACGSVTEPSAPAPDAGSDTTYDAAVADADSNICVNEPCGCELDSECAQFEVCNTNATPLSICQCAPAYEEVDGDCVFGGAPADPGFQTTDTWTVSSPIREIITTDAVGNVDTGTGTITGAGICRLESFSQVFTMPPIARSETFAVDVSYTMPSQFDSIGLSVSINGGWHNLPQLRSYGIESFCLGERGYGGDIEFAISSAAESQQCPSVTNTTIEVDHFSVRKALADECPEFGQVRNGDCEDSNGWLFEGIRDGSSEYADAVGVGNSRGIQLATLTRCSAASATTQVSLPTSESVPNSAIEFYASGAASNLLSLDIGGREVSRFAPSGLRRVCVPDWAKGTVQDMSIALKRLHSTGTCSASLPRSASIDAFSIVSDPACGNSSQNFDNSFEVGFSSQGLTPGWAVVSGSVNGTTAPASIDSNANNARTGSGSARLTATNVCNSSHAIRDIVVPATLANEGPAVKAFFRVNNAPNGHAGLKYTSGYFESPETIAAETGSYQETILCIPPRYSGRQLTIEAFATGGGGGCSDIPTEVTYVDDIEVTTDASCPSS